MYELREKVSDEGSSPELVRGYHKMIKKLTGMMEDLKMNTSVSELMIFINLCKKENSINKELYLGFLKALAPFAPFVTEELWQELNGYKEWQKENSIHLQEWPEFDPGLVKDDQLTIPVQVNGKLRDELVVAADASEDEIKKAALASTNVKKYTDGKEIKKYIYVPGKIVNIVV